MANYVMGFVTGLVLGFVGTIVGVAIYGSRVSAAAKATELRASRRAH